MTWNAEKPSLVMIIPSRAAGRMEAVMAALADAFATSGCGVALGRQLISA